MKKTLLTVFISKYDGLGHKIDFEEKKQAKEVYSVDCKRDKPMKYKLIIRSDP